jgi:hypothetical protein
MEMQEVETQTLEPQVDPQPTVEDMIHDHIEKVDKDEQNASGEVSDELKADQDGEQKTELKGKEEDSPTKSEEEVGEKAAATSEIDEEASPEGKVEENKTEDFAPDLSFTFRGKKHDMPEELKGVIDSQEKLEFYQDLFSKAEGLPIIKEKGMQAQQNLNQVTQNLDQFYGHAQVKDFSKAFELAELPKPTLGELVKGFGYSDKDLIQLAYDRANMSDEQVRSEQIKSDSDRRVQELEQRLERNESSQQQQFEQQVYSELQGAMSEPDTNPIVQAYDAKFGEGAFMHEVAARGEMIHRTTKKIERPSALVKQVIERYNLASLVNQPVSQTENTVTSQPASNAKRQNTQDVPVIPAIESGGGSPGQRKIRTLADIEKIYQDEYGSN